MSILPHLQSHICSVLLVALLALTGCSEVRYYTQSVNGHFDILGQSKDIESLIHEKNLDSETSNKLQLVLKAREYAATNLKLSINNSYTHYADLGRDYVVENLFAAEEFSTQLYSWCYPLIGCANYRGYFDRELLAQDQRNLNDQSYDTYVSKVTAYSTLGWFNDPVLNTFIDLPEYRLVGLIFHELAHQQIYIRDDTDFNESFATAVEQAGLERFYSRSDEGDQLGRYRDNLQLQKALVDIAVLAREELDEIYQQSLSIVSKRGQKKSVLQRLEQQYSGLVGASEGKYVFNNARLGAIAAYHSHVPAFLNILESHGGDFLRFYSHSKKLGKLNPEDRGQCLRQWSEYTAQKAKQPQPRCQAE